MSPLILAFAAFGVVIGGVLWLRLPAFLPLIFAALLVAIGTPKAQRLQVALEEFGVAVEVNEQGELTTAVPHFPDGFTRVYRASGEKEYGFAEVGRGIVKSEFRTSPQGKAEATQQESSIISIPNFDLRPGDILLHESQRSEFNALRNASAGSRVAFGFGETCRKIGILIAMASVIGCCLLESGAAQQIVEKTQSTLGEQRTPLAFAVSGFVVGIPVFFDTLFYLLMPLAKAMRLKTGGNYLLYVMSIVVGGSMAHSLVPPTPGPLLVASRIEGVDVVDMMLGGFVVGIFAVASGFLYALWANRRWEIPLRDLAPEPPASATAANHRSRSDQPATNPPSWFLSLLPILLPVVLLAAKTIVAGTGIQTDGWVERLVATIQFFGDKNIALSVAALVALAILVRQRGTSETATWTRAVQNSLSSGGMILLITCAGGAFGHTLRESGVANAIQAQFPATQNGIAMLFLAFLVTMLVRFVQGSATVAMITSVGIVGPLASQVALDFHPVYLALAIGCGSKPLPWMNDSGFWIVGKMSGMTEAETLRTFSVTLTIMGIVGFLVTLTGAVLLPLR